MSLVALAAVVAAVTPIAGEGPSVVAPRDPLTLAVVGPALEIVELHTEPVLAPGGERAVFGMSAPNPAGRGPRIGMRIVDAQTMAATDVATGIAAESVGWLGPTRAAALVQSGQVVVVDATSGAILRRRTVPVAVLGSGFPPPAAFDATGGGRVLVVGSGGRVAELRGSDLVMRFRRLRGARPGGHVRSAAMWDARRLVAGSPGRGAWSIDTRTWRTTRLAARGGEVAVAGGTVAIAGARAGLRLVAGAGERVVRRFGRQTTSVSALGGRFYVRVGEAVHVVDPAGGRDLATVAMANTALRTG
jgi:hypothetical protein